MKRLGKGEYKDFYRSFEVFVHRFPDGNDWGWIITSNGQGSDKDRGYGSKKQAYRVACNRIDNLQRQKWSNQNESSNKL